MDKLNAVAAKGLEHQDAFLLVRDEPKRGGRVRV